MICYVQHCSSWLQLLNHIYFIYLIILNEHSIPTRQCFQCHESTSNSHVLNPGLWLEHPCFFVPLSYVQRNEGILGLILEFIYIVFGNISVSESLLSPVIYKSGVLWEPFSKSYGKYHLWHYLIFIILESKVSKYFLLHSYSFISLQKISNWFPWLSRYAELKLVCFTSISVSLTSISIPSLILSSLPYIPFKEVGRA